MASGLNRYGGIPTYRVQNVSAPSVGGATNPRWTPPRAVGGGGGGRFDEEDVPLDEERLARMREANPENLGRKARDAANKAAALKAGEAGQALLDKLGATARGQTPEQVEAREADRKEGERIAENKQLKKLQTLSSLAHQAGDADIDENGFRVLGPESNQMLAEMTGMSNLAITKGDEKAPRIAVKLVGDPEIKGDGAMQFFVERDGGFQPLLTSNGAPVQPRLAVVNQATALMDYYAQAQAMKSGKDGKAAGATGTDVQKEGMSNAAKNAQTRVDAAQKSLQAALTNDPENRELITALMGDYEKAVQGLKGAGETAPGAAGAGRNVFALQPDFDRQGNPWKRGAGKAAPAAAPAATAAPGAIPAPTAPPPAARAAPGAPAAATGIPTPSTPSVAGQLISGAGTAAGRTIMDVGRGLVRQHPEYVAGPNEMAEQQQMQQFRDAAARDAAERAAVAAEERRWREQQLLEAEQARGMRSPSGMALPAPWGR